MNTQEKYQRLIERAIKRVKPDKPYEKHHVVPQCFMKNDWTVNLTAAEHILAHKYLAEMTEHPKLLLAYQLMVHTREGVKLNGNILVKVKEAAIKAAPAIACKNLEVINNNLVKDQNFLKKRAKAISLGKWGKVKLEYNGLCYYNKKYLAKNVGKTTRTITSWIQKGKVIVHNNESITYDSNYRKTTTDA